jgi:hypothetical protein
LIAHIASSKNSIQMLPAATAYAAILFSERNYDKQHNQNVPVFTVTHAAPL